MSQAEHKAAAPKAIRIFVLTASDTRGEADDKSGAFLRSAAAQAGHELVGYQVVKDEPAAICAALEAAHGSGAQVIVANGGTGISVRDRTYEAVAGVLEKRLDGFGELFRMLSYADIGSAAMLSRAVGGVWRGVVIFSLPGSTGAVKLGWEKLIAPEIGHLVGELSK